MSARAIAKTANVSDNTVRAQRAKLEVGAEIPHHAERGACDDCATADVPLRTYDGAEVRPDVLQLCAKCWARRWRAGVLRHNVGSDKWGWAVWAQKAANGRTMPQLLRYLGDVTLNPCVKGVTRVLTDDERFVIANVLAHVAAGEDVRTALRIAPLRRGPGRPPSDVRAAVALEVCLRIAEGDTPSDAVKEVAKITDRSEASVWKDYDELKKP